LHCEQQQQQQQIKADAEANVILLFHKGTTVPVP